MGYPSRVVLKAMEEHGEDDEEAILNAILTYLGQNKYFETMNLLEDMGFQYDEAFTAINRCGLETPIEELVEFIDAAKMGKEDDLQDLQVGLNDAGQSRNGKKQKLSREERWTDTGKHMRLMIGFGVPNVGIEEIIHTRW
ncbi:DNA (cytosine-5)-methyltransferase DRM1-like [Apium graveolens]|uniref:DNA (cytosine-5)-methyltransferase DRM1-like n=1 Tax=Apium graveolens TaxID=4045 RepID=UPI003D79912C